MRVKYLIVAAFLAAAMLLATVSAAKTGGNKDATNKDATNKDAMNKDATNKDAAGNASATTASASAQDEDLRLEGEKRFRSNCSRCHAAPLKFAPRMAATIVQHMRVRANITDEDRRLIVRYLSK